MPLLGAFILPHPPLIVPEIGRGEEKKIQKTIDAYECVAGTIAGIKPDTIVVISPHSVLYSDYIHISPGDSAPGNFGMFGAKGVEIEKRYDTEFVQTLSHFAQDAGVPAGIHGEKNSSLDHGVMVPLYFIEKYDFPYKLVRISVSGLSPLTHYRFGQCITKAAEALDRKVVLIASGDLSHKLKNNGSYGFAIEGPEFDRQIVEAMKSADFLSFLLFQEEFCDAAAECGLRSFIEMAGALDGKAVLPHFLSYEGTFGVGYGVCYYELFGTDGSRHFGDQLLLTQKKQLSAIRDSEDPYVKLARQSLEHRIRNGGRLMRPDELPAEMTRQAAGVFVSLKKEGRLRGCIGTISATRPSVADEIIQNAISAGTDDPRFDPVEEEELDTLVYSVDVLSDAEPVSGLEELDPKLYGVIVFCGGRQGLLLPNLEGVDTPRQQIDIALQKAGISEYEKYRIQRFRVVRHH